MTGSGIDWIDLFIATDPHPRRFDSQEALRLYLSKAERLSDEAIERLLSTGLVEPPLSRRVYRMETPFQWV